MENYEKKDIRRVVRDSYGKIAKDKKQETSCCGGESNCSTIELSSSIGYSAEDLSDSPEGANMGLGCGNPQLLAEIKEGETVIDLGSGAGFDSFLASKKVGPKGLVIGVDMTPEMVSKSSTLSKEQGYANVDFRLGEIENLPIADGIADVIISNCVINLSAQKQKVYEEAYRVLKEGGRLAIADIVLVKEPTDAMKQDERLYCGWVTGASSVEELEMQLKNAGFSHILIKTEEISAEYEKQWSTNVGVGEYIKSASIKAIKISRETGI